jgi:hypothetical protein
VLSIDDASELEVDPSQPASITFTLSLSHPVAQQVTVAFVTTRGTASAIQDYVPTSGTVTFPPTSTTASIAVALRGDLVDEHDETFFVDLSGPVNAVLGQAHAVGTILDNDPLPTILLSNCTVFEGSPGSSWCTFGSILSPPSEKVVIASYTTADGSASAGSDYVTSSGTVTFPASPTQGITILVEMLGDLDPERDETFSLRFTSAENAIAGDPGTGLILDDDRREIGLAHGMTLEGNLVVPPSRLYRMEQAPLASYEVVLDSVSGDAAPELQMDRVGAFPGDLLQQSSPVGTGSARSLRWQNTTTNAVPTEQISIHSPGCSASCSFDDVFRLRVYETTGRIARFNNSDSQASVVVLQNSSAEPLTGLLHFWNGAGERLFVQPFALGPRQTLTLSAVAISALQGASGSITVTHDGPYGALSGKAVALEPATGYSFDSPLTVRSR